MKGVAARALKWSDELTVVSDSNTIAVKWASSRDIDSDYVAGSTADIGIDYEIKFLETNFIKLLKIFKRENFKFLEKMLYG